MLQPSNPFQMKMTTARRLEIGFFWATRIATYFIIFCATYIFADILIKGGSYLFKLQYPFIDIPFLTEAPETLHIIKVNKASFNVRESINDKFNYYNPDIRRLGETSAVADITVVTTTPEGNYKEITKQEKIFTFSVEKQAVVMGDSVYIDFGKDNVDVMKQVGDNLAITDYKTQVYAAGGIFPNIVGTVLLVVGSMIIALSLGILSAIFLSEYSKGGRMIDIIRLSIMNLAGVPSIVFGMFGYGMFVITFGWNVSLMAGWFTLAFMVLPIIITASEESLRAVPKGFREGALALGATKWQSVYLNVLPYALPGILTSSVLGIARVAGETAPIMFTAAFVVRNELPWQVQKLTDFFFNGVMALPYHIFVVSARVPQNEFTHKVQYEAAFVFLFIVMVIAAASIWLRIKVRGKYKW